MPETLLSKTAQAWGLPLDQRQLDQFAHYASELQRWNEQLNLTRITALEEIDIRHFLDSLSCALYWGKMPQSMADIGTGAGFPGIPLKILNPTMQLSLIESIEKKGAFLRHMAELLQLSDTQVIINRAEALGQQPEHRERYQLVTARAVADLRVLAEYSLPLCQIGGRVLAPKGPQAAQEVEQAAHAIGLLGGRVVGIEPVILPHEPERCMVIIEKVATTPSRYPRANGIPSKRPL